MLLYLDTSGIAKLYLQEPDAAAFQTIVRQANGLSACLLSYIEMHSLIARQEREKRIQPKDAKRIREIFQDDWNHFAKVPVDEPLVKQSAQLVRKYALRTLDAIQLAAALSLKSQLKEPLLFLTADHRLELAASKAGLRIS